MIKKPFTLLNATEYKDKVRACWIGKNIGGTMGAPYEGKRELLDIKGFSTAAGEVLPNDDLDLQLVWLHALENLGVRNVNRYTLGEEWLSFITPHWNEYGIGKLNMKHGLVPPISGEFENPWKHSNGAWIRTEIWATSAPAAPDVAAEYAIEDACVDHGIGEGTVAAAFVAAMQSAAFATSDLFEAINAGLARIPKTSRVALSVKKVLDCYKEGKTYVETRNIILEMNSDIGDGWFEAPSNVAYTVIGLVYGEGDFKKSMIYALNCGDDTDCTGATVGATMGILYGMKAIPTDWAEHIGDNIVTLALAMGVIYTTPKTCSELTDRVCELAPTVLYENGASVKIIEGDKEIHPIDNSENNVILKKLSQMKPYEFEFTFTTYIVKVTYDKVPTIAPNDEIGVTFTFYNRIDIGAPRCRSLFGNIPYYLNFRWILPEGFSVEGPKSAVVPAIDARSNAMSSVKLTIRSGEKVESVNRLVLEILADGRMMPSYIPFVLLG